LTDVYRRSGRARERGRERCYEQAALGFLAEISQYPIVGVYRPPANLYRLVVSMMEANVEVKNRLGLHLRAASTLAQSLKQFDSTVTLSNGRNVVNARSVTSLMTLGAAQGTKLKLKVDGTDAQEVVAAVKSLFEARFGEE